MEYLDFFETRLLDEKKRLENTFLRIKRRLNEYGQDQKTENNGVDAIVFTNAIAIEEYQLGKIHRCLEKTRWSLWLLNNGGYGICTNCGGIISIRRLIQIPYADCCNQCKKIL